METAVLARRLCRVKECLIVRRGERGRQVRRMSHSGPRPALIYQHTTRERDEAIADAKPK
jgi:hypothetical protein